MDGLSSLIGLLAVAYLTTGLAQVAFAAFNPGGRYWRAYSFDYAAGLIDRDRPGAFHLGAFVLVVLVLAILIWPIAAAHADKEKNDG